MTYYLGQILPYIAPRGLQSDEPPCWACLDTGFIIDLVELPRRGTAPGADHGKRCPCGQPTKTAAQEASHGD